MPSRLKSLELHGYKTFAAHTSFVFADTVTAIVGPNGSGKSNIADAIRWVLGEQSFSLLRGKRTEDMIFAGSELRPRANLASATLTFDNSDGWLPIDFAEVAITRRAYRDGENEYLLNGQRVRLRDISELLARSGLAERTYTIIGQGLVDAALALKAEERRRLFEEAAGIGLYRSRREEALRRLDTTRHNLERVHDILAELLPRLKSLERQAKRAQEYDQVRDDLRVLLRDWYGYHWHLSQRELIQAKDSARQSEINLEKERASYAVIDKSLDSYRERLLGLRARLNAWHRQSSQLHTRRESISRSLAVLDERSRLLIDQESNFQNDVVRLKSEVDAYQGRLLEASQEIQSLQAELDEARAQAEIARQKLHLRQEARANAEKSMQEARQSHALFVSRMESIRARLVERQNQAQQQEQALQNVIHNVETSSLELKSSEEKLSKSVREYQSAEHARQKSEEALQLHLQTIAEGEEARRKTLEIKTNLQADLARLKAQLDVVTQAENTYAGYANGTKVLLQAAREARLEGVRGAFSNFLEVPSEYESAIGAALGEFIDAVILDRGASVEEVIENISAEAARAALLPINDLIPETIASIQLPLDCTLAADIVSSAPEFRPAIDLLLGDAWIVPDRDTAQTLLRIIRADEAIPANIRIITLQGDVFHIRGPILAGRDGKAGVLARPRQRRELQEKLEGTSAQLEKVLDTLRLVDEKLNSLREEEINLRTTFSSTREIEKVAQSALAQSDVEVEKNRRQLQFFQEQRSRLVQDISRATADTHRIKDELDGLEQSIQQARDNMRECADKLADLDLDEFLVQVSHWNTRTAVADQALGDAGGRLQERQRAFERITQECQAVEMRIKEIHLDLQTIEADKNGLRESEGAVNQEIGELQQLIDPAEKELEDLQNQQEHTQVLESQARQALSQAEQRFSQVRINLARKQETLDSLTHRIEDDFGLVAFDYADDVSGPTPLPLDGMVEQLPALTELPVDLEENIRRQRAQLRRIGPINPEAQREFEEVQQRYDFLTVQVADLNEAEAGIKEVIAELDLLMEREFRKTFDSVAREFRQIFARLFDGGSARLVLTDPQDLTATGIDIEARLPGRREQGLSLLSGGERSLTASALVFSLLKVSPTPFCVFDEVDAMLDEANVSRFREFLEELSRSTQFITITHNRNTVQVADVIYGITMGRDSASQVISLKLDEVSQIVE